MIETTLSAETESVDTDAMLNKGSYYILSDFAQREEMHSKVVNTFLDGIAELEDRNCRDRIADAGVGQMHKFFPAEKVPLLEDYLLRRLRTELYHWSYRVGEEDLGLKSEFFIDYFIIIRIHYPFHLAKQAKNVLKPPYAYKEKLRLMTAALKNWRLLSNLMGKVRSKFKPSSNGENTFDPKTYHRNLPEPARSHGAHVDTWYGHSYDGINLWWSIDGVNEDNTVILYPELFGQALPFDPRNMYLAPGVKLPKPHKPVLKSGELLVFNPEVLHGTQVNISDSTRVAVSTRINPKTPRFDAEAPFHFEQWFSSEDVRRKKFWKLRAFAKDRYPAAPRSEPPPEAKKTPPPRVIDEKLSRDKPVLVCESQSLGVGESVAINLSNAKLLVFRDQGGVRAYSRVCPHLGVDLADGCRDDQTAFCPGHGVEFSLANGTSSCAEFTLRRYEAFEKDGSVYVQHSVSEQA